MHNDTAKAAIKGFLENLEVAMNNDETLPMLLLSSKDLGGGKSSLMIYRAHEYTPDQVIEILETFKKYLTAKKPTNGQDRIN